MFNITNACELPSVLKVLSFVIKAIKIVYFLIPMFLIVLISIDFFKSVLSPDDTKKNNNLIIKRIISIIALFLLPTIISVVMNIINDSTKDNSESLKSCFDNIDNIAYFQRKYNYAKEKYEKNLLKNKKTRELKQKKLDIIIQKSKENKNSNNNSNTNNNSSSAGITPGKTYQLDDATIKKLAALAEKEQGAGNTQGTKDEISLLANLYELKGSGYSSIYDYAINSTWFTKNPSELEATLSGMNPSADTIAITKDILVNGNRTLPLYIDEHDCWDCATETCNNGTRGDICSVEINGTNYSDMSTISSRSDQIYKKDQTKIYSKAYQENTIKYWTFYYFPSNTSDPFGYSTESYNKIKGSN